MDSAQTYYTVYNQLVNKHKFLLDISIKVSKVHFTDILFFCRRSIYTDFYKHPIYFIPIPNNNAFYFLHINTKHLFFLSRLNISTYIHTNIHTHIQCSAQQLTDCHSLATEASVCLSVCMERVCSRQCIWQLTGVCCDMLTVVEGQCNRANRSMPWYANCSRGAVQQSKQECAVICWLQWSGGAIEQTGVCRDMLTAVEGRCNRANRSVM